MSYSYQTAHQVTLILNVVKPIPNSNMSCPNFLARDRHKKTITKLFPYKPDSYIMQDTMHIQTQMHIYVTNLHNYQYNFQIDTFSLCITDWFVLMDLNSKVL